MVGWLDGWMVAYSVSVIRDEVQRSKRLSRRGLGEWNAWVSLWVGVLVYYSLLAWVGIISGNCATKRLWDEKPSGRSTLRVEEHACSLCCA